MFTNQVLLIATIIFMDDLVLSHGDKPFSSKDLHEKLLRLWKPINPWKMIPLGQGIFEL